MAFDEGLADLMREDLAAETGIVERQMFGGLAFLLNGHMVCGVHRDGAMFRVGKDREAEARAIDGTGPMMFTGRPMGGMVSADDDAMAEDGRRLYLLRLALTYAKSLPPK